jgi:hypothetical protein
MAETIMIQIADIFRNRNGRIVIKFINLDIYRLLKNELGFRYTKIKNKGYFLKESNGIYEVVNFYQLNDSFIEYIKKEYNNFSISREVEFEDFINDFYRQAPIKKSNFVRTLLSENFKLSDSNLEYLLNKNNL